MTTPLEDQTERLIRKIRRTIDRHCETCGGIDEHTDWCARHRADKTKATPEIAVATAYLCAEDAARKEIDALKAAQAGRITVKEPADDPLYLSVDPIEQKEITALRERAEKAEAALATVQDLSHPNCRMLIAERDKWKDIATDLYESVGDPNHDFGTTLVKRFTAARNETEWAV